MCKQWQKVEPKHLLHGVHADRYKYEAYNVGFTAEELGLELEVSTLKWVHNGIMSLERTVIVEMGQALCKYL